MRLVTRLLVLAAALAGCLGGARIEHEVGGVDYVVEGRDVGFDEENGRILLRNEEAVVTSVGGRLSRDGADLGPVAPGDRVRLSRSGAVTVNGMERAPVR